MANEKKHQSSPVAGGTVGGRKKTKVKLPVNAFDGVVIVLIVLVAVLAVSGTQLASLFGFGEQAHACTVEYMVMFSDVDRALALAIGEDATAYGNETGAAMGTVVGVPEVQAHRELTYVDGAAQMKEKPDAVDIVVTIRSDAEYLEGTGYTVGDVVMRVGNTVSLRFPGYTGVGNCINVSRQSD